MSTAFKYMKSLMSETVTGRARSQKFNCCSRKLTGNVAILLFSTLSSSNSVHWLKLCGTPVNWLYLQSTNNSTSILKYNNHSGFLYTCSGNIRYSLTLKARFNIQYMYFSTRYVGLHLNHETYCFIAPCHVLQGAAAQFAANQTRNTRVNPF